MLALGFAETKDDVHKLISAIDRNGNGEVELDEFLAIIKSGKVRVFRVPSITSPRIARRWRTTDRDLLQRNDKRKIRERPGANSVIHK